MEWIIILTLCAILLFSFIIFFKRRNNNRRNRDQELSNENIWEQAKKYLSNIDEIIDSLYCIKDASNYRQEGLAKFMEITKNIIDICTLLKNAYPHNYLIKNLPPSEYRICLHLREISVSLQDHIARYYEADIKILMERGFMGNDNPRVRRNDIVPEINRSFGVRRRAEGPVDFFEYMERNRVIAENANRDAQNANNRINIIQQENRERNEKADKELEKMKQETMKMEKELAEMKKRTDKDLEKIKHETEQIRKETEQIKREREKYSKEMDQKLEEIKKQNAKEIEEMKKQTEEVKKQTNKEIEEMKKQTNKEIEEMKKQTEEVKKQTNKDIEEMKKQTEEVKKQTNKDIEDIKNENSRMYAQLFGNLLARAEMGEKSMRQLQGEISHLSSQMSSISSRNSLRSSSFKIFNDDQETPEDDKNIKSNFTNANMDINLNANQEEKEKNNKRKSLLDKINNANFKQERNNIFDKKEDAPKLDKQFDGYKKEDDK